MLGRVDERQGTHWYVAMEPAGTLEAAERTLSMRSGVFRMLATSSAEAAAACAASLCMLAAADATRDTAAALGELWRYSSSAREEAVRCISAARESARRESGDGSEPGLLSADVVGRSVEPPLSLRGPCKRKLSDMPAGGERSRGGRRGTRNRRVHALPLLRDRPHATSDRHVVRARWRGSYRVRWAVPGLAGGALLWRAPAALLSPAA